MKKNKRNKPISIDDKFLYDEMKEFVEKLGVSINTAFPGYLRQPIKVELNIKDNYIVTGMCALNTETCKRMVSRNSEYNCDMCLVYKEYFNERKT